MKTTGILVLQIIICLFYSEANLRSRSPDNYVVVEMDGKGKTPIINVRHGFRHFSFSFSFFFRNNFNNIYSQQIVLDLLELA